MKKILLFILSFFLLFLCPITTFAEAETYTEECSLIEEITITEDTSFNSNIIEFFSELSQFETPEALNKISRVSKAFFIILTIIVLVYIIYKIYKGSKLEKVINKYKENKNEKSKNINEVNGNDADKEQSEEKGSGKSE